MKSHILENINRALSVQRIRECGENALGDITEKNHSNQDSTDHLDVPSRLCILDVQNKTLKVEMNPEFLFNED